MNILNPSEYIRDGIKAVLSQSTGLLVWHKMVPVTVRPIPSNYIIIDNQTKNETVNAKEEYFEWLSTIDVNIYRINPKGTSNASVMDDTEQKVINAIRFGFQMPNFSVKNVQIMESIDLDAETGTHTIERRLIKFEMWLNRAEEVTT